MLPDRVRLCSAANWIRGAVRLGVANKYPDPGHRIKSKSEHSQIYIHLLLCVSDNLHTYIEVGMFR